ncbi:MAG TPA: hypothetical protein VKV17_01465 [Bryobacteraceae bacterium]|nr:hypothetical protein [Bryobacteraceae bacterium]
MTAGAAPSRREFLAIGFGWFPLFRNRGQVALAGARFRILRNGKKPRHHYLHIHGDEETARQVLESFMEVHPGVAFLIENKTRNVSIMSGELDPNRMFSREGAEVNLKTLNPTWTYPQIDNALDILDHGRDRLVNAFLPPKGGLLVALHNNTEAYSVNDEVPISDSTSLRQPSDPHAFFICTDPADFRVLQTSPYNVVLQQKKPQQDDGSLSRLAAARAVRYINLEVERGNATRQAEMLEWLNTNLAG